MMTKAEENEKQSLRVVTTLFFETRPLCVYYNMDILKTMIKMDARYCSRKKGGARSVMVIIVGNGHGDTRSNPGRD